MYQLNQIYQAVLNFAGMTADEKGYVTTTHGKEPVFVEGNRLVTPTQFQLRDCPDRERLVFHPLAENAVGGEHVAIKKLRANINIRLNQAIMIVGQTLLSLVASPALHKKLTPQQFQVLTKIPEVDDKSTVKWSKAAVTQIKAGPDRAFVNLYLCRGGEVAGKKYARLGVASFPCLKQFDSGDWGDIRTKDRADFRALLEYMFPGCQNDDAFSVGSDSTVAPFLDALMRTGAGLAFRLNELIEMYEEFFPFDDDLTKERLMFSEDWVNMLADLEALRGVIATVPPQGNGGVVVPEPAAAPAAHPQNNFQTPVHQPMVNNPPQQQQQQPVVKTEGGVDFGSLMNKVATNQPQMSVMSVPMVQVMTPQGPMMVPAMQVQQQQMPTMVMPGGMVMPQGMQAGPRVPTWAQTPPTHQMVMTPQGPMTQAAAMQYNIPYQIMNAPMPGTMPNGMPQQYGMNPTPSWAGR